MQWFREEAEDDPIPVPVAPENHRLFGIIAQLAPQLRDVVAGRRHAAGRLTAQFPCQLLHRQPSGRFRSADQAEPPEQPHLRCRQRNTLSLIVQTAFRRDEAAATKLPLPGLRFPHDPPNLEREGMLCQRGVSGCIGGGGLQDGDDDAQIGRLRTDDVDVRCALQQTPNEARRLRIPALDVQEHDRLLPVFQRRPQRGRRRREVVLQEDLI